MKIIVIMRETFPTNEILTSENIYKKKVLNPYDEYALYQAIELKNKENAQLIVIMLNKDMDIYNLKTCLALGADQGRLLNYKGNNPKFIALAIFKEIKKEEPFDFIFMGIKDINNTREELPSRISRLLNIPLISNALNFKYENKKSTIQKESDFYIENIKIKSPCIIATNKSIYKPKYPTIENIINVNKKIILISSYHNKLKENLKLNISIQNIGRKNLFYSNINSDTSLSKIIDYITQWRLL